MTASEVVVYQCHGNNVGPMGTLRAGNGGLTGGVPFLAEVYQHTGSGAERTGRPSLAASDDNGSNQVVVYQNTEAGVYRERPPSLSAAGDNGTHQLVVGFDKYNQTVTGDHACALTAGSAQHNNASVPHVVCATGDRTHARKSVGADASEDGTGRGTPIVAFRSHSTGDDGFGADVAPAMTDAGGPLAIAFHLTQDPISHPDRSPCLGTGSSGGAASVGVATRYVVRRLTPTECQRLQDLPDWWLDLDPPLSDSAKYRMTGNAGVVACVRWILSRLRDAARRALDGEA